MKFKFLEHTGDVKFQAFGKNINELFENSALALKEVICGKIKVKGGRKKTIKVNGRDYESMLHNFLEELLYLLETEKFIMAKTKVKVKGLKLSAVVYGDKSGNYNFVNPVKAVTYSEIFVKYEKGRLVCQVVLDV